VALTVEDGSIIAGADTYATVIATQAFATARGLTLPTGTGADAAIEKLLIVAMDYLEALRADYQGSKIESDQPLQWPRSGVLLDGFEVAEDEIPACLVQAQMRLACYAYVNGNVLSTISDGRVVVEETVANAITMKYADHGDNSPQPQFPEADKLIAPLLQSASFGGAGIAIRM
jgi:hypothetical protein